MGGLPLVAMATTEEQAIRARRRGWLLFVARRTDPREPTLADAAIAAGLKKTSASSISDWERGLAEPKTKYVEKLAVYYHVPIGRLLDPEPIRTDEERMAEWRAELARAAIGLATEDVAREAEGGPADDAPPVGRRGRQPA